MKNILLPLLIISLFLSLFYSQGYCEKESLPLSVEEATILLKSFDPHIRILTVKPGPVGGLWEVAVESGGKKGLVYIDSTKKYLISGAIITIEGKKNLTQETLDEINKVDVSQIPLADALVMGDKEAKYRVIVFDDPE